MRPKIVILTLVIAFGVLGLIVLLKGIMGKNGGGNGPVISVEGTTADSNSTAAAPVAPADSNSADTTPRVAPTANSSLPVDSQTNTLAMDEARAALIQKEVDAIQEIQGEADDSNKPTIIAALAERLQHPEGEVRQAAVIALKELDDTNAVPKLELALKKTKDPREIVFIMNAIEWIKQPSATANVPPELATNRAEMRSFPTNVQYNPAFLKGNQGLRK